jgi:hypothetical protein
MGTRQNIPGMEVPVPSVPQRRCGHLPPLLPQGNAIADLQQMFFLNNIYFLLFFFGATAIIYATGKHPLFR